MPCAPMSFRSLPSVSALLAHPRLAGLPHAVAVRAAREALAEARARLVAGEPAGEDVISDAVRRAAALRRRKLRRVINATGVVLHTNLGRAPLAPDAVQALLDVARGYSNTELDLESGQRGGRLDGIASLVAELTGAEAAIVVNNNAAAVLLALTALAAGREVVVSRGELVEIGGSFRVPDVIASGGARLVEVGTTNRTRAADYGRAITPETALLLRVHPSNFRMLGFVERPDRAELVALAHSRGLPVVDDLGSGALPPALNTAAAGFDWAEAEPVDQAIAAGVDLVCFSCDKLLGGPQAGVIAGRRELVDRLKKHPLYRALRVDKLVLAALEATLLLYREGRSDEIPARAMLNMSEAECQIRAERLAAQLPGAVVEADLGYSGGGALPAQGIPSRVVALRVPDPAGLARRLRQLDPPVVARVARDALLLDPRTLLPGDEPLLVAALAKVLETGQDG